MPAPDDAPRRGRPPKLTDEMALGIAAFIEEGNFLSAAAKAFGVGYTTVRTWVRNGKKYPDGIYGQFRTLVLEAEAKSEINAVRRLLAQAQSGDSANTRFYLERRHYKGWSKYKSELEDLRRQLRELERKFGVPPVTEPDARG